MRIDIITLFPEMFQGPFDQSIMKRAREKGLVKIEIHNLRKWAEDKHKTVDDRPYGGGVGMVLMVEPIHQALQDVKHKTPASLERKRGEQNAKRRTMLLDPGGKPFTQKKAEELSRLDHLILLAGHYEGVDHRVREHLVDEEISIGDYILTGGELPAMVVVDAVVRLVPGVLEKPEATRLESFSPQLETGKWKMENLLEHPQYTRPEDFMGWKVPEVLLSGNHKKIGEWRTKESIKRTKKNRPDLLTPKR